MNRVKIEGSSNIAEIGYNPEEMTLEIKFTKGRIYKYHPITLEGWKEFMKSESKGKFFAEKIRSNPNITHHEVDEMQGS